MKNKIYLMIGIFSLTSVYAQTIPGAEQKDTPTEKKLPSHPDKNHSTKGPKFDQSKTEKPKEYDPKNAGPKGGESSDPKHDS